MRAALMSVILFLNELRPIRQVSAFLLVTQREIAEDDITCTICAYTTPTEDKLADAEIALGKHA
jgi:hypothetical protein